MGGLRKILKWFLEINCEYWEIRLSGIRHTKRDCNRAAHLLAKKGACLDSDRV